MSKIMYDHVTFFKRNDRLEDSKLCATCTRPNTDKMRIKPIRIPDFSSQLYNNMIKPRL